MQENWRERKWRHAARRKLRENWREKKIADAAGRKLRENWREKKIALCFRENTAGKLA
jgi:hypothetical protein